MAAFGFDNGTHGTYDVAYPDRLGTYGGSGVCLTYTGTAYNAGVQFAGAVSGGSAPCHVVSMGFPLETVYASDDRDTLFSRIMGFFGVESEQDVVPPEAVGDLAVSTSGADVLLAWSAVTQDTLGSTETVAHYVVYRTDDAWSIVMPADSVSAVPTPGWTDPTGIPVGGQAAYYRVTAIDLTGNQSSLSPCGGALSFDLP